MTLRTTVAAMAAVLLATAFTCLAAARPEVRDSQSEWVDRYDLRHVGAGTWSYDHVLVRGDETREVGSIEGDFASAASMGLFLTLWSGASPEAAQQSPTVIQQAKASCQKSAVEGCCNGVYSWPPCSNFCWYSFTVVGAGGVTNCSSACASDHGGVCPPKTPTPGGPSVPS